MTRKVLIVWLTVGTVFGAGASIAIAWATAWNEGLMWWTRSDPSENGKAVADGVTYAVFKQVRADRVLFQMRELQELSRGAIAGELPVIRLPGWARRAPGRGLVTVGYGWPFPCMHGVEAALGINTQTKLSETGAQGWWVIKKTPWGAPQTRVPVLPIWSGLAADSVLFGAPIVAVAIGMARAVRRRRAARGECVGCGYSREGLPDAGRACPECGADGESSAVVAEKM